MQAKLRRHLIPVAIAALATLPGITIRLAHLFHWPIPELPAPLIAVCSGLAVLGASFLLLWACDAIQEDISQTLALAIVALIAVLPEYAVDMYVTWQAASDPGKYAPLAIANMTGANRLIIGAAWMVIVGLYWIKTRRSVRIEKDRRTELFFLGMATVYAFFIALKGRLEWYDGLVYVAMYAWYIRVAGSRPSEESEAEGPAELLVSLPKRQRRLATVGMFLFSALTIALNAEQFCEGLITTGGILHIPQNVLIQWLAPIASEAPEFTVAIMFTLRKRAGLALGSLLSANLNQWTLLVGMIPFVYGIAHGSFDHPIPMNSAQMHEILLTAAQSLLGIFMLATLRLSIGQVILLFGLFVGQLAVPPLAAHLQGVDRTEHIHLLFSAMYVTAAIAILLEKPTRLNGVLRAFRVAQPAPAATEKQRELTGV